MIKEYKYTCQDITAIILAGGRGTRFNNLNKGLINVSNRPLISFVIEKLKLTVPNILISANEDLNTYEKFGYPVVKDEFSSNQGPLAGILSCKKHIQTALTLIIPCDAPLFPDDYVMQMLQAYNQSGSMCMASDGNRNQYLFLLFASEALESLQAFFENGDRKVALWVDQQSPKIVSFSGQPHYFTNVNTAESLARIQDQLLGQ